MISPKLFCDLLLSHGIDFYCGVPDSLLKNLCSYIDSVLPGESHIITANEGNAVALAIGRHIGSNKASVVYMQNSGLGNAVNPLTSLADDKVYGIPMLLIIGWRGEPGIPDEPQHIKQGEISEQQLKILDVPYQILAAETDINSVLPPLLQTMRSESRPVALLVRQNTFENITGKNKTNNNYHFVREQALQSLLSLIRPSDLVVSTTGKTSREVFEVRQSQNQAAADFLTVGGMGHTSSIAMGVALARPDRKIIAIDGDGSMLMHMGALPVIGNHQCENLVHIVLNNQAHESVGGQETVAGKIDLKGLALASGYKQYYCAQDDAGLRSVWEILTTQRGPTLLEIKIAIGSRDNLGRPTKTPKENKLQFMKKAGCV